MIERVLSYRLDLLAGCENAAYMLLTVVWRRRRRGVFNDTLATHPLRLVLFLGLPQKSFDLFSCTLHSERAKCHANALHFCGGEKKKQRWLLSLMAVALRGEKEGN